MPILSSQQTASGPQAVLSPGDWSEPMSREERDSIIEKAADAVAKRGLEATVIWALEMHKPFAFLASQAVIVGTPSFAPLLGIDRMQTLSRFLGTEGAIEALIERIEERSIELEHRKKNRTASAATTEDPATESTDRDC